MDCALTKVLGRAPETIVFGMWVLNAVLSSELYFLKTLVGAEPGQPSPGYLASPALGIWPFLMLQAAQSKYIFPEAGAQWPDVQHR